MVNLRTVGIILNFSTYMKIQSFCVMFLSIPNLFDTDGLDYRDYSLK